VLLDLGAPSQRLKLVGRQEHGRTIPLSDIADVFEWSQSSEDVHRQSLSGARA
jgi:hypothetical protein